MTARGTETAPGSDAAPDAVIATIAGRQRGLVTRAQLVDAGLSPHAVAHRVRLGRLHRLHRGVYAVGHLHLDRAARWLAAVLASGGGAVLSHADAGEVWSLRPARARPPSVDVSIPVHHGRSRRAGIVVHRVSLTAADTALRRGIPATSPARTLIDLAPSLTPRQLERALDEAVYLRLVSLTSLADALERNATRPGARRMHAALERHRPGRTRTRNALEERFLALCRDASLPEPEANVRLGRFEVDFLWREQRVVVETDGFDGHRSLPALERDHDRDAELSLAGYRVRRFAYRQVTERPGWVAAVVRAAGRVA